MLTKVALLLYPVKPKTRSFVVVRSLAPRTSNGDYLLAAERQLALKRLNKWRKTKNRTIKYRCHQR
jgi:hypothetical protein